MRITLLGAATDLGRRILTEAERAGIVVTCLLPSLEGQVGGSGPLLIKDYAEITAADLASQYAVVDALSFTLIESFRLRDLPWWRVLEAVRGSRTALLGIAPTALLGCGGGAHGLVYQSERACLDGDERRLALCVRAWRRFRDSGDYRDCNWSLLCPPLNLMKKGISSGRFEFTEDVLPMGLDGSSQITMGDFARATVECLKLGIRAHHAVGVRAL
ncbi:MAG: hypothetical protein K6A65_02645 [Succinivibrionaceae bacterium]|nr:hypothetical protein [Succinivibrionaceae bacterium]